MSESESDLVKHAERELGLIGQTAEDPEFAASIIGAVREFSSYGHSGGSAMAAADMLNRLLRYKCLSPVTTAEGEWVDRSEESGYPLWQAVRDSSLISEDGGLTHWSVDDESKTIRQTDPKLYRNGER